ncbi:hypothetical protein BC831DRAFT_14993 [Entophlyctis helioformis]|nr:hypothetical protein BC831DRAFT_14993 [Entophlyctis helioformis]
MTSPCTCWAEPRLPMLVATQSQQQKPVHFVTISRAACSPLGLARRRLTRICCGNIEDDIEDSAAPVAMPHSQPPLHGRDAKLGDGTESAAARLGCGNGVKEELATVACKMCPGSAYQLDTACEPGRLTAVPAMVPVLHVPKRWRPGVIVASDVHSHSHACRTCDAKKLHTAPA